MHVKHATEEGVAGRVYVVPLHQAQLTNFFLFSFFIIIVKLTKFNTGKRSTYMHVQQVIYCSLQFGAVSLPLCTDMAGYI
jgi:hypothetical protein